MFKKVMQFHNVFCKDMVACQKMALMEKKGEFPRKYFDKKTGILKVVNHASQVEQY